MAQAAPWSFLYVCISYFGMATQMQTCQQSLSFGMISVSPAFGYSRRHTSICVNLWSVFPLIALESVTFLLLYFSPLVGTEELGHLEMVGTLVHQLTRNLSEDQIRTAGFDAYFVDHTTGVYPQFASGYPWSASTMQVTGDIIADLTEDLAAEQKARLTYDNILRLSDDPDVNNVIRFLREREIVHFQRFGEAIELAKQKMDQKNVYFTNPAFDK